MAHLPFAQPDPFFNRTAELSALERAWNSRRPVGQMLLLRGRRRLGKTYLLQRFFAGAPGETAKPHCYYLADQTTAASQRLQLAEQVLGALPEEGVTAAELAVSWNQILRYVSASTRAAAAGGSNGRFGLILDEFPYLVQQTPELPSILQSWWDRDGAHAPVFVVLCGSQLSAMEALGSESAPLFGRFTAGNFLLSPLTYNDVACFYADSPHYGVAETLTMYGVLGGTPRYHALVDPARRPRDELVDLLFRPRGALEGEVSFLLGSEQIRDPAPYNAVLAAIAQGHTQFGDILSHSGTERGQLSFYLKTLLKLDWITRELPFEETSDRRALYGVADPFLAFWYRFVQPLASALSFSDPAALYQAQVEPLLPDYMGRYVFEKVCHQWLRKHAAGRLGIVLEDAGRWWSRDGQLELDVMARLAGENTYLFGECKWSQNRPVGTSVYTDLVAKVARLPEGRHRRDPRYVLFSVGGFTPELAALAAEPGNRLSLVDGSDLLPSPQPDGR